MTVNNKGQFLSEISKSDYYNKFARVPNLLESFGDLLDKYSNNGYDISIGIAQNFDLKYNDGNVICRIEQDGNYVKVSGKLNGASISIDKKGYYNTIYLKYKLMKSKHHLNNAKDVRTLIEIIEKFMIKNKNI